MNPEDDFDLEDKVWAAFEELDRVTRQVMWAAFFAGVLLGALITFIVERLY